MQNNFPEYIQESRLIRFLLKIGSSSELDPIEKRKRISAVSIQLIIIIVVFFFSIYHYHKHHYDILAFDLLAFFVSLSVLLYLRRKEKAPVAYWMIGLCCMLFAGGTTIFGRTDISIFLWAFILPAISFAILGDKKGLFIALVFSFINLFLMTAPETIFHSTPYSSYVVVRFNIIYLMLTFIIYYYESSQQLLIRNIQREKDKFENASKHDFLTGLSNRRDILDKMESERKRQERTDKPFTVMLGDIDNFKSFNDTFGHTGGDYVLQEIGQILKSMVRGIDCPSRWGGEEFLIMLVETDLHDGERVAERIRKKIENTSFKYKDAQLSITMTFGLSGSRMDDENIDACIKRADKALYEGKNRGKNVVVLSA